MGIMDDLFGDMFDFNNDGETDIFEQGVGHNIINDAIDNVYHSDDDDDDDGDDDDDDDDDDDNNSDDGDDGDDEPETISADHTAFNLKPPVKPLDKYINAKRFDYVQAVKDNFQTTVSFENGCELDDIIEAILESKGNAEQKAKLALEIWLWSVEYLSPVIKQLDGDYYKLIDQVAGSYYTSNYKFEYALSDFLQSNSAFYHKLIRRSFSKASVYKYLISAAVITKHYELAKIIFKDMLKCFSAFQDTATDVTVGILVNCTRQKQRVFIICELIPLLRERFGEIQY